MRDLSPRMLRHLTNYVSWWLRGIELISSHATVTKKALARRGLILESGEPSPEAYRVVAAHLTYPDEQEEAYLRANGTRR